MLDNQMEYCITQLVEFKNRQIEINEQVFNRLDVLENQIRDAYIMITDLEWNSVDNKNKYTAACCALHAGGYEECK